MTAALALAFAREPWRQHAECRNANPTLFDYPEGRSSTETRARLNQAARYCGRCPVLEQCLTAGVQGGEEGVWGGMLLTAPWAQNHRPPRPLQVTA